MSATYRDIIQSRKKKDDVPVEHHYLVDVFIVAIDSQLQELNNRFNKSVSELLRLSVILDPKKSFNADDICKLVTKYYPLDFTEQERIEFRLELQYFELDSDHELKNVSSLSALCRGLQETEKTGIISLMSKKRTIDSFFKPIKDVFHEPETQAEPQTQNHTNSDNIMEESPRARVEPETNTTLNTDEVRLESLIRDPGVRPPLLSYPSNQQAAWFKRFWWLEYSDTKDAAFCFPCYLFGRKPIGRAGSDTFTAKGFNNWRKVSSGKDCPFVSHEGKTPASAHNFSVRCYEDLKNKLTLQTCPLRGGDERPTSLNRGNYLELVKLLALYNKDVARVVLEKAPKNAKYTSPDIQKELLQMFAMKVQEAIRDEIGTTKFCL
ncbi:zinc finger MYM-type protein 1-like protein, partial [Tanacetum coccineum]